MAKASYGMLFGGAYIIPCLAGSCLYFSTFSAVLLGSYKVFNDRSALFIWEV
jgi:hypothetical protein